jgi:hypothetical protein
MARERSVVTDRYCISVGMTLMIVIRFLLLVQFFFFFTFVRLSDEVIRVFVSPGLLRQAS